ncbi:uncharacterized protein PgNI_12420 [Pyricularia grisea]|uniref:Uncharacterized protein n=1 Tax=Pyricularia grisea TaxID=148305 RepID=A0A6P8AMF4_PYRGI|nr:uncharacterized protein PgNI_12420 [Pyricularia grisea]TLD03213.1 hypothetical protein PgNI_12420 [Pyricularia grisea]
MTTPPRLAVTTGGAEYSSGSGTTPPFKPNRARIPLALSSGVCAGSTRYVWHDGTNSRANSSRLGSTSVMTMGCAPDALAAANAIRPMGPAPHTTAPLPRLKPARRIPCSTTDRGSSRAPSAYERPSGSLCSHRAGWTL